MDELQRVLTAASGLLSVVIGILVFLRGSRRSVRILFSFMTFCVAVWSFGEALGLAATGFGAKIFWNKLQGVGQMLLIPTYLAIALYFPQTKRIMRERKRATAALAALYAPWVIGLVLLYTTGLLYSAYLEVDYGSGLDVVRTPLYWLLTALGFCTIAAASAIFLWERHRATSLQERKGLLIPALAPVPMLIANLVQNLGLSRLITTPQFSLLFIGMLAYGILRYGLFLDIRSVAKGLVSHALVIVFDAGLITLISAFYYYGLDLGFSAPTYWLFVLTVVPFLFAYHTQVAWVEGLAERVLYERELEEGRLLQDLSRSIRTVRNLDDLASSVVDEVRSSMDLSFCALMLKEEGAYRVIAYAHHPDHLLGRLGDMVEAGVYVRRASDFYTIEDRAGRYSGYCDIADRIHRRGYTLDRLGHGVIRVHGGEGRVEETAWGEDEGEGGTISVPLEVGGEDVGLLWLGERMGGAALNMEELDFIAALSTQVAVSLLNSLLLQELLDKSNRLQRLVRLTTTAQEEERMRISRELHDGLAPFFLDIIFKLDMLEAELEGAPPAADSMEEIKEKAREGLRVLRQVISDLRPSSLDVLGLEKSLASYLERFGAENGVETAFDSRGPIGALDSLTEVTIFRVAQEALSNVAHHARAGCVRLALGSVDGCLELTVEDDGIGFHSDDLRERIASGECLGLKGMAERAELVQGDLEVHSRPGAGTRVKLRIPSK